MRRRKMVNKNVGIIAVAAVLSALFWYLAGRWISDPVKFIDPTAWIGIFIVFVFLISLIGLAFLFLSKYVFKLLVVFISGGLFFVFFSFSFYYLLSVTLFFWFSLYAIKVMKEEERGRTRINVRVILQGGFRHILTAFLIMISFAYFLSPAVQSIAAERELPPTFNQTVREIFVRMFEGELDQLSPQERSQAENRLINEVIREANTLAEPFFKYLPPLLAFALFLILRGLGFIFVLPALGVGILTFNVLKKLNFFKITEVQIKSEILEI